MSNFTDGRATISSNGIIVSLSALPIIPQITVEGFAAGADFIIPEDVQIGDAQKTADGLVVSWGKNTMKGVSLTVSAASNVCTFFDILAQAQERYGNAVIATPYVIMTVSNIITGQMNIWLNGVLTDWKLGMAAGADHMQDKTAKFKFGTMITI